MRLVYLTNSGYHLETTMKACAHTLDRIKLKNWDISEETQLLKQDLRYHCESPISPFSAFSLSHGTLIGTFATIITYLIVLIQFKVTEVQSDPQGNGTVSEMSAINGMNVTEY